MADATKAYVVTLRGIPFAICEDEETLRTVAAATIKTIRGMLSSPLTIEITHSQTGMSLLTCKTGPYTETFIVYEVSKF